MTEVRTPWQIQLNWAEFHLHSSMIVFVWNIAHYRLLFIFLLLIALFIVVMFVDPVVLCNNMTKELLLNLAPALRHRFPWRLHERVPPDPERWHCCSCSQMRLVARSRSWRESISRCWSVVAKEIAMVYICWLRFLGKRRSAIYRRCKNVRVWLSTVRSWWHGPAEQRFEVSHNMKR